VQARASRRKLTRHSFHFNGSHQQPKSAALRIILVLALVLVIFTSSATAATVLYFNNVKLPELKGFKSRLLFQNTQILASNGSVLYDMTDPNHGSRIVEPLELDPHNPDQCPYGTHTTHLPIYYTCSGTGIPLILREATIATEDPTFYSNPGFDPLSILRAAYQNLSSGHIESGASTITQQLVKQYVLDNQQVSYARKLKEIILAYQMTRKFPKDYILYYYLNSVYYGDDAFGVEAAAESYFHKHVSQLTLWQAAVLAGLPQSPSDYDPFNNPTTKGQWYGRMLQVLEYMRERGYITRRQEIQAERNAQLYTFHYQKPASMQDPDFVQYVIDQFQAMTDPTKPSYDWYLKQQLGQRGLHDGLKIITTLNPRLQQTAQNIVTSYIRSLVPLHVTDGALVSIDVRRRGGCYGCILAMVGTANVDPKSVEVNMADSPRQPGSSFKVYNYLSAFEKGLAPATTVLDAPISLPDGTSYYTPENYDHLWHGVVTLRLALANSLNIPAVKVEVWNGVKTVARTAYRMGITDLWRDNPHCCGWSLTLGGLEQGVKLVQHTAAYGALATEGLYVPPISFTRIIDRTTGKVLWDAAWDPVLRQERNRRVAPAADTYLVTSILSDNNARSMEFGPNSPLLLDRPAAAKTGTTNDFTDNWTMGYTPQIVTGVWVGNADRSPMIGTTGITGAAPIWHDFMEDAFQILNLPPENFTIPPGVYTGTQCRQASTLGFVPGSFSLDYYAGTILPYCTVPTVPGLDSSPVYGYNQPYSSQTAPTQLTPNGPYLQPVVPATPPPIQVVPNTPAPVNPPAQNGPTISNGNASNGSANAGTGNVQPAPPPPINAPGNP
jgi:membrane peptidoglycan carboxypeptidase